MIQLKRCKAQLKYLVRHIRALIKKMGSNMVEIILYILLTESMTLNFLKIIQLGFQYAL